MREKLRGEGARVKRGKRGGKGPHIGEVPRVFCVRHMSGTEACLLNNSGGNQYDEVNDNHCQDKHNQVPVLYSLQNNTTTSLLGLWRMKGS